MAALADGPRKGELAKGFDKGEEHVGTDRADPQEEYLDLAGCRLLDFDRRRHRHKLRPPKEQVTTGAGGDDGSVTGRTATPSPADRPGTTPRHHRTLLPRGGSIRDLP